MHIALVAPSDFQGYPLGGTESLVREIVGSLLAESRHELTLVGVHEPGLANAAKRRTASDQRLGSKQLVAGVSPRGAVPVRLAFLWGLIRHRRRLRHASPDVVYAHNAETAVGARQVWPRVPLVLHLHGLDNPLVLSRFAFARHEPIPALYDRLILRRAIRSAARVVVNVDKDQFSTFVSNYGGICAKPPTRMPAMVDTKLFRVRDARDVRNRLAIPADARVVMFVGRLERPKQVDRLIEAFDIVIEGSPGAQLLIVGDGGDRKRLESIAGASKASGSIRFLGPLARKDVADLLPVADVFASCSKRESISMALLEAMASGVPCVVGPVGGAREVIEDGLTGFVASRHDPVEIASLIERVLESAGTLRRHCVAAARSHSTEQIAPLILRVLECAVRGASSNVDCDGVPDQRRTPEART